MGRQPVSDKASFATDARPHGLQQGVLVDRNDCGDFALVVLALNVHFDAERNVLEVVGANFFLPAANHEDSVVFKFKRCRFYYSSHIESSLNVRWVERGLFRRF